MQYNLNDFVQISHLNLHTHIYIIYKKCFFFKVVKTHDETEEFIKQIKQFY